MPKKDKFKEAVASAAGTTAADVDILDITEEARRAGSVKVETQVWCCPLVYLNPGRGVVQALTRVSRSRRRSALSTPRALTK